jgi:hypothetical protein
MKEGEPALILGKWRELCDVVLLCTPRAVAILVYTFSRLVVCLLRPYECMSFMIRCLPDRRSDQHLIILYIVEYIIQYVPSPLICTHKLKVPAF